MKKSILFLFSFPLFFSALSPLFLTSCAVTPVAVRANKSDALIGDDEKINFSCDFYGVNIDDFDWTIEPGYNFDDNDIILGSANKKVVNNTMFIEIPLNCDLPNSDVNYFTLRGVFFNKNHTIVKKTEPISCYRNLYSPYLFDNMQISLNEKPSLKSEYFSNPDTYKDCDIFTAADKFLDVTEKDGNGKYVFDDFTRIKHIFHADLVCFTLFTLQNFRSFDIGLPIKLSIGFNDLKANISYLYNIEEKNFEYIKINIDFTGLIGFQTAKASINMSLENYKILGVFTKLGSDNTQFYDHNRKVVGNFLSLVPLNEESIYTADIVVNLVNLLKISFNHDYWLNNSGMLGIAGDIYSDGGNSGFYIPCYNLDGEEFSQLYGEKDDSGKYWYEDASQIPTLEDKLLIKTKKYDLKKQGGVLFDKDMAFYVKEIYKDMEDIRTYTFDTLDKKLLFLSYVQQLATNPDKEKWLCIRVKDKDNKWHDIHYWQYLSRIQFYNTKDEYGYLYYFFIYNSCFCLDGEKDTRFEHILYTNV